MIEDLPLYGLDIETDTSTDGLDPHRAAVVAVAVATADHTEVLVGDERELLARLEDHLGALAPGVLVTWNGSGFDLPFLALRARLAGVPLGLRISADPWLPSRRDAEWPLRQPVRASWGRHLHLDGFHLYRCDSGRAMPISLGLKPMSRLVGLEPVEVDRERIHALSDQEVHDYVASDAVLARALVARRWPAAASHVDVIDLDGLDAFDTEFRAEGRRDDLVDTTADGD